MHKAWMFKMKSWGFQNPTDGEGNQNAGGASTSTTDQATAQAAADAAAKAADDASKAGSADADELKRVSDEKAALLKEVMQKKEKLTAAETKVAELAAKLKDFDGLDATELRKLVADKKAADDAALAAAGQWDALKASMAAAHATETAALQTQLQAEKGSNGTLTQQIADLTVGVAFGSSNYLKEELSLSVTKARVVYGQHFEYKDGAVVAYDKPVGAANRTMLVDARGEPLAFEAALEKIVEADPDRDSVKKAKGKAGSGSGSNVKQQTPPPKTVELKGMAKIAAGLRAQK